MFEALLFLSLSVAAVDSPPQDPLREVRRTAERAAFYYEALLRRRAPSRLGGGGGPCDEIIGRFCFRFGDGPESDPPPEHPDMAAARRQAIAAQRAWFSLAPGEQDAAGPLLRFLIEDGRPSEAVAAARTHAWAAGRSANSLLLLGMTLHHDTRFAEAEAVFDSARAALPPQIRRHMDDVEALLAAPERRRYRDLSAADREVYHRRFWRFSDPSLADVGNERRSAHYARHAWALILADAPRVRGAVSWGRDTEEILIRYGRPAGRERIREPVWRFTTDISMVEIFDPDAVALVPERLTTRGLAPEPEPGFRPELERDTARSAYASLPFPHLKGLTVQTARFQEGGGGRLVVAGALEPDSADPEPRDPTGLLVVMDTLGREVARVPAAVSGTMGGVVGRAETVLGPGHYVYRLEVTDDSSGIAGLAQHEIEIPIPTPPGLSDLLLGSADDTVPDRRDAVEPRVDRVFAPGEPLLVWAEAAGLARAGATARYAIEWWVEPAERSLLGRALRWLGRQVGVGDDEPLHLRWEDSSEEQPAGIAFALDLSDVDFGLYRLRVRLTDRITNQAAESARLFRVAPRPPLGRNGF